ncbi:hypothetical protein NQZ68_012178 [Dissostichus eleginoides]|nr:hypothetical protein NQZ68_012178 [Dissostichus eleginoides]
METLASILPCTASFHQMMQGVVIAKVKASAPCNQTSSFPPQILSRTSGDPSFTN